MATKQFWICTKLSIEADNRVAAFQPDGGGLLDDVQPRRAGRAQPVQSVGYGYGIASKDAIKMAFTTKEAAQAYAKQEAGKNPNVVYGVFECCNVYETTTPQVIEKTFTAEGELRLVESVA